MQVGSGNTWADGVRIARYTNSMRGHECVVYWRVEALSADIKEHRVGTYGVRCLVSKITVGQSNKGSRYCLSLTRS